MADGVSVEPLGSLAIGASVFPEAFGGLIAIRPAARTVLALSGCATELERFIAPSADANVAGSANAIASAIAASFMTILFLSR
jgi:hypothetical protein